MVATPDCAEEARPTAGKKVRRGCKWLTGARYQGNRNELLTCLLLSSAGLQANHGKEKKSSHKQVFGPVKVSLGELLQHQRECAASVGVKNRQDEF